MIPDVSAPDRPQFADAEHSVLADDIKELKFGYYGISEQRGHRRGANVARPVGRPAAAARNSFAWT